MLKLFHDHVWCFDAEWVPDPAAGRRLYSLPKDWSDAAVCEEMYKRAKGYDADLMPRPYLKTVLCRVVCISVASVRAHAPSLSVKSFAGWDEHSLLYEFFTALTKAKRQLVGYNSREADMPILLQRCAVHDLRIAGLASFLTRPEKPWLGCDYLDRYAGWHTDLCDSPLTGYGNGTPKLAELCAAMNIPGKADMDGGDVYDRWLAGDIGKIALYCEEDAMRLAQVFVRVAAMSGALSYPRLFDAATLAAHPHWAPQWLIENCVVEKLEPPL